MFFVCIDIGKNNHIASMMNESGKVVFKAFSFPNTSDGGNSLFSKLSSYSSSTSDFEIGMEATGHYWLSLIINLFVNLLGVFPTILYCLFRIFSILFWFSEQTGIIWVSLNFTTQMSDTAMLYYQLTYAKS